MYMIIYVHLNNTFIDRHLAILLYDILCKVQLLLIFKTKQSNSVHILLKLFN